VAQAGRKGAGGGERSFSMTVGMSRRGIDRGRARPRAPRALADPGLDAPVGQAPLNQNKLP
jgi:hypothetical protein